MHLTVGWSALLVATHAQMHPRCRRERGDEQRACEHGTHVTKPRSRSPGYGDRDVSSRLRSPEPSSGDCNLGFVNEMSGLHPLVSGAESPPYATVCA